jgi:hypothetical protein
MPRRKKHTIPAIELPCFEALVAALKELPELTAGFDAAAIQVIVPEHYTPKIKDISKVIDHFQRYVAMNRQYILETFDTDTVLEQLKHLKNS